MRKMLKQLAKLSRRNIPTAPGPKIRWPQIIRIEATGTDAFGSFQVWLEFIHEDGDIVILSREQKGYDEIVESLHTWYPGIPARWYEEMSETPWHAERVLFSRENDEIAKASF